MGYFGLASNIEKLQTFIIRLADAVGILYRSINTGEEALLRAYAKSMAYLSTCPQRNNSIRNLYDKFT